MSTGEFLLRAEHLTKKVSSPEGELTILDDVTIGVPRGHTAAIVGPSGAGKSTLLALLAGLDEPTSGRVWLNAAELTALDEDGRASLRNREVGFVFQSFHLLPSLTAIENVLLPLELAGTANAPERARQALVDVGLDHRLRHYPKQLSGGEKQRVAIARTLLKNPPILLLDEATSALDTHTEREIQSALRVVSKNRTTLVIAHRLSTIIDADEILVLDQGQIVERGRHADLVARGGAYAAMWNRQKQAADARERLQAVEGDPEMVRESVDAAHRRAIGGAAE
jgi:ABC-type multidrug transport system fused ATPase/permease subunit